MNCGVRIPMRECVFHFVNIWKRQKVKMWKVEIDREKQRDRDRQREIERQIERERRRELFDPTVFLSECTSTLHDQVIFTQKQQKIQSQKNLSSGLQTLQ